MQQPEKNKGEEFTFTEKFEQFLIKNRKPLLIGVSVVLLGLIIFGIASTVQERRITEYTERVEQAQDLFEDYRQADDEQKAEISSELQNELYDILDRMDGAYPGLRALHILGELAYQEDRYDDAKEYFLRITNDFPHTHLAPVSLMNAAVISEQLEDYEGAISYYQQVAERYSNEYHGAPRALLNIGRLYEELDDTSAALQAYEQLTAEYQNTEWANLAQTRIIQLEIGM